MKKAFLLATFFLTVNLILPSLTLAKNGELITNLELSVGGLNFFQQDLGVFITAIVNLALIGGSVLTLFFLIWGGMEWIASEGDKAKYEAAKSKITAAFLGLAILASAWAIWLLVNFFFGLDKAFKIQEKSESAGNVPPQPPPYDGPVFYPP